MAFDIQLYNSRFLEFKCISVICNEYRYCQNSAKVTSGNGVVWKCIEKKLTKRDHVTLDWWCNLKQVLFQTKIYKSYKNHRPVYFRRDEFKFIDPWLKMFITPCQMSYHFYWRYLSYLKYPWMPYRWNDAKLFWTNYSCNIFCTLYADKLDEQCAPTFALTTGLIKSMNW